MPALLTAVDSTNHVHLIIGSNSLAGARCARSLEVGAVPKLIAPPSTSIHYALAKRVESKQVEWFQSAFQPDFLTTLGRSAVNAVVDAVFVTLPAKDPSRSIISDLCRRLRIPINVTDSPSLSTFTLLSTHSDGPLQIGITTSGQGCKLATRIRREVAAALPPNLGAAVSRLGGLRSQLWREAHKLSHTLADDLDGDDDDQSQPASFNQLVQPEDIEAARGRRLRWLSQICEYWPLKRLANITDDDISAILLSYRSAAPDTQSAGPTAAQLDQRFARKTGTIILAGSGPGSPQLLTLATLQAIKSADVVLADKLVPERILDLIPRRTLVHIARKFPGNAEAAQDELLQLGLAAVKQNQIVLRLKQGDPYLYGRGGEEVLSFRQHGIEPVVLPGITSSLSAPLFAGIPVTMRDIADQVLICTGTGRKGKMPDMPAYRQSTTVVFLMALHRLPQLVAGLTGQAQEQSQADAHNPSSIIQPWPPTTPCTIIERASCHDQRLIHSTLEYICPAVDELGSRPPGLLVLGRACQVLHTPQERWSVEDGFKALDSFHGLIQPDLEALQVHATRASDYH